MSNPRPRRWGRVVEAVLLIVLALAAALAMVQTCRGQCAGGVCQPPPGWRSPPSVRPRWSEIRIGPLLTAAVCRVANHHAGSADLGTGTLVRVAHGRAYVLTCSHLLDGGVGRLSVQFPDSAATPAEVLARDTAHDVALLITTPPAAKPVATADYRDDSTLIALGLGGDGRLRAVRGEAAGRSTPQGARYPSVVMYGAVRPGDSGGPLINLQGQVIGVVWGARGQTTYAAVGEPVSRLLRQLPSNEPLTPLGPQPSEPHIAAKPPQASPACDCQCKGDCVLRNELADLVRRDELSRYATREELQLVSGPRSEPAEPPPDQRRDLLAAGVGALATALGLGGPAGVALFAAQLLLRRRAAHRRGPGGPRAGRFQERAEERAATLRVEPTTEQARRGRHPSTAPKRGA